MTHLHLSKRPKLALAAAGLLFFTPANAQNTQSVETFGSYEAGVVQDQDRSECYVISRGIGTDQPQILILDDEEEGLEIRIGLETSESLVGHNVAVLSAFPEDGLLYLETLQNEGPVRSSAALPLSSQEDLDLFLDALHVASVSNGEHTGAILLLDPEGVAVGSVSLEGFADAMNHVLDRCPF